MARSKSEDKRNGLVAAAISVIAAQGLGAPTALIAREAGVSNGSLFTYFETKSDLFNQLFLELKTDMAVASLAGRTAETPLREQFRRLWDNWMTWATANPDKRRVLALLSVSDEITGSTKAAAQLAMAEIAEIVGQARACGPLRDTPAGFAEAAMNSLAEATMDFIVGDPVRADEYRQAGFGALCRLLGGPMLSG